MENFTDRFASLLQEKGWTPEEAARHLPVSSVAVRSWIAAPGTRGVSDPRASHVLAICDTFGVRPEWLIRGDMPRERYQSDWPFIVPRARIEQLPMLIRALIDRLIYDIVELLDPAKNT